MKHHNHRYKYCIFYLEDKYYQTLDQELKRRGYDDVTAIIPTVTVMKGSTSRGKVIYKEEPILFNYGFLKIPTVKALDRDYLRTMARKVPGIRGFLKDTITLHTRKKKRARVENIDIWDDFSLVATCSRKQVRRYLKIQKENKKFSVSDLTSIKPGDYVNLKGYPYEGVDATVLEVDHTNKKVKLLMYPQHGKLEVWLPFDNVFYSVYHNYDPRKLYVDQKGFDPNGITQDKIDKVLSYHQI